MDNIKTLSFTAESVLPSLNELSKESGNDFSEINLDVLKCARSVIAIEAGFKIIDIEVQETYIYGDGFCFTTGSVIAKQLKGCNQAAVFLISLGNQFDEWSKNFFAANDPVRGFLADKIGSITAENCAVELHDLLDMEFRSLKLGCSNRFSPGYCGWDVAEQQILFNLLPVNFCGVKLNDSSLMEPLKSISGIIGVGENVMRTKYPCSDCDQQDCLNRDQE